MLVSVVSSVPPPARDRRTDRRSEVRTGKEATGQRWRRRVLGRLKWPLMAARPSPRLRRLPRLEVAPMIDADNERASDGRRRRQWATAAGDQIGDDYVLSSVPSSLTFTHSIRLSLSLIHFRRDIRSRRGPLLGGRGGGAWHHGVHHVQIGADNQLHQIPDGALRGLLRGVRGNWEVRTEDKCWNVGSFFRGRVSCQRAAVVPAIV